MGHDRRPIPILINIYYTNNKLIRTERFRSGTAAMKFLRSNGCNFSNKDFWSIIGGKILTLANGLYTFDIEEDVIPNASLKKKE